MVNLTSLLHGLESKSDSVELVASDLVGILRLMIWKIEELEEEILELKNGRSN